MVEAPPRDQVVEEARPQEPQGAQAALQTRVAVVAPRAGVAQEPREEQAEAPVVGRMKDAAVQAAVAAEGVAAGRRSVGARH